MQEREVGPDGFYHPIGVLIAEPRRLIRDAYLLLIRSVDRFNVVGDAGELTSTLTLAEQLQPDVILLNHDIALPRPQHTLDSLRDKAPSAKTILITNRELLPDVTFLIRPGHGIGLILTESSGAELLIAVQEVHEHGFYLAAGAVRRLPELVSIRRNSELKVSVLTPRERELLGLISAGKPNREIAKELVISVRTVEAHKARMISRLGLHNTTELLRYALNTTQI